MPSFPAIAPQCLDAVERRFRANFEEYDELGAAVSVWQGERELIHLAHGWADRTRTRPWTDDTLVPVWSCTKGPAAAACLLALEQQPGLSLDAPVAEIWPAFAGGGKGNIRFHQLLSHQAGLAALDEPRPSLEDHAAVIRVLEKQEPLWRSGHGYHPRTHGFLLDECVRRLTGAGSLGQFWFEELAQPLGLDVWVGLPASEYDRVAHVYPGRVRRDQGLDLEPEVEAAFYQAFSDRESLSSRAFASPRGLSGVAEMNRPGVWAAGYPAFGGVASARGLAGFYAFLAAGGTCAGTSFFRNETMAAMEQILIQGEDRVLLRETAFAAGFMKDPVDADGKRKRRSLMGPSVRAFGHPGAGGSLAFADPDSGIGFAYVMNRMSRSVFPTEKALQLVRCLYGC